MARFFYGLIAVRGLLPALSLAAWPEAEAHASQWAAAAAADAGTASVYDAILANPTLGRAVDFRRLDLQAAMMVHGGVDAEGLVSPYASLMLARSDEDRLHIEGRCLDRHELDGRHLRVRLEEIELDSFELRRGLRIDRAWDLPAALEGRRFLTLRLEADDYVYAGPDLQRCVAFRLERVALERSP
jgi:hypothetical protein